MGIYLEHEQSEEFGSNGLQERLECLILYLLFATALAVALGTIGTGHGWAHLALPVALGMSVLTALRFRLRAVLVLFGVEVVLVVGFYFGGLGCFSGSRLGEADPEWFVLGLIAIFTAVSFIAAIVAGYHLQSAAIARQRQNMLYKIFDSLPVGIWVRARTGATVFVNDRWVSFSPMTKGEILRSSTGKAPVELGELWEQAAVEVLDAADGTIRYQAVELTDPKGHELCLTLLTLRIFIDNIDDYGTLSLLVDETALRVYEEKVRTSEHSLRLALDNADMGFWDHDLGTGKISCDSNWLGIMGMDRAPDSNLLRVWKDRIYPEDQARIFAAYEDYIQSGRGDSMRIDYRIRTGEGEYIWVEDHVGVVEHNEDGSIKRIMGTMQDVTSRKQAEMDLKYAKERAEAANEAKGQFIATISHEIRTPLNAIIGLSSFLAETKLTDDQVDLAHTIYTSGKSLLLLVNDILDFSKIEAGRLDLELQEYPLHLCFEECLKLFKRNAEDKGISLTLSIDPSLPEYAMGDLERLRQIVQNLLANALKFTEVGAVEICVRPVQVGELLQDRRPDVLEQIGYLDQADREYLEVLVKDSGIGIPEERQHVLFEAFSQVDASTTRKYGGTGLGLAICKRLVSAMGGTIWLESEDGEGAVFGFVVRTKLIPEPTEHAPLTRSPFEPVDRISEEHPCDVLVVGPNGAADGIMSSCRRLGYAPHHTLSYDYSSGAFQRRHYDVIFIWMEDESGALELSRGICGHSRRKKTAEIVGCVPAGRSVAKDRCELSGMRRVLEAPASPRLIKGAILSALGGRG